MTFDWKTSRGSIITLGVLFTISMLGLSRDLWTPDEPREAEISREMFLSRSVVPALNGRPFIEKPPLYYWVVAGAYALSGDASPAAARTVSAIAAFLTLLLVYFWGRREFSATVGCVAAIGLATSSQFMISTHWVLIDPLLMFFTTAALWAAWEVIHRDAGWKTTTCFYSALILALWMKGLIGPVLVGCGLAAFFVVEFKQTPWRRLRIGTGFAVMVLATAALAWAIYESAGFLAVREWFWVNHVQRFVDPVYTGHEQPVYYYLSVLPTALLPWWIVAFDALRPRRWRGNGTRASITRYWGLLVLGMVVILSASVTKRGIYLLPLLPPMFLMLAAQVEAWWKSTANPTRTIPWWLQVATCTAFAGTPVVIGIVYLRDFDPLAVAFLAIVTGIVAATVTYSLRGNTRRALGGLTMCALAGVVGLITVIPHLAEPEKGMTPFVTWVGEQLPQGVPVYAVGHFYETIEGIVPFVTGRRIVALTVDDASIQRPEYLLVQDATGGTTVPRLPHEYRLLREKSFGPGRYLALWERTHQRLIDDPSLLPSSPISD